MVAPAGRIQCFLDLRFRDREEIGDFCVIENGHWFAPTATLPVQFLVYFEVWFYQIELASASVLEYRSST